MLSFDISIGTKLRSTRYYMIANVLAVTKMCGEKRQQVMVASGAVVGMVASGAVGVMVVSGAVVGMVASGAVGVMVASGAVVVM